MTFARRYFPLGMIAALFAMILATQTHGADATSAPVTPERHWVRVASSHIGKVPEAVVDPCAFGHDGAALLLTEAQMLALTVPYEYVSSEADFLRRFRPEKTMATVGVPSIAKLLGEPVRALDRAASGGVAGNTVHLSYDRYHTPEEGIAFFHNLAATYPSHVRISSIGQSVEGRDLWLLKISDNVEVDEPDEQASFFCALHHAREWVTHEMILYLAEQLATGYDTDLRIQHIVDNSVVWLVLAVNPDGFAFTWEEDRFWRKNRRDNEDGEFGVDLNRNYDYLWGPQGGSSGATGSETYRGPSAASEPETQAIQTLLAETQPAIAVTYHTYSQLVLFPWGYVGAVNSEAFTPMRAIGERYADLVRDVHGMNYVPGVGNYTIYPVNGDFTDYAYGQLGTMAYTPELRPTSGDLGGFALPEDQLLANNEENFAAALWIMDAVASAKWVDGPPAGFFGPGDNPFSLPVTPANQKPEVSLNMTGDTAGMFSAWLDDQLHWPARTGFYPAEFESVSPGSGYVFSHTAQSAAWADAFDGYMGMPFVFENGAAVMIENTFPMSDNQIGIPSDQPVRMRDLVVIKRRVEGLDQNFGRREVILESRTALEDMNSVSSWISWDWHYTTADGQVFHAHPTGDADADEFLHPYRAYTFRANVRSVTFYGQSELAAVYLILFPPPLRGDTDQDGYLDQADYAAFHACLTNPVQTPLSPACRPFDFDHDVDVDIVDFGLIQRQFEVAP